MCFVFQGFYAGQGNIQKSSNHCDKLEGVCIKAFCGSMPENEFKLLQESYPNIDKNSEDRIAELRSLEDTLKRKVKIESSIEILASKLKEVRAKSKVDWLEDLDAKMKSDLENEIKDIQTKIKDHKATLNALAAKIKIEAYDSDEDLVEDLSYYKNRTAELMRELRGEIVLYRLRNAEWQKSDSPMGRFITDLMKGNLVKLDAVEELDLGGLYSKIYQSLIEPTDGYIGSPVDETPSYYGALSFIRTTGRLSQMDMQIETVEGEKLWLRFSYKENGDYTFKTSVKRGGKIIESVDVINDPSQRFGGLQPTRTVHSNIRRPDSSAPKEHKFDGERRIVHKGKAAKVIQIQLKLSDEIWL